MIRPTKPYRDALRQLAGALAEQDAANVALGIQDGGLVSDLLDMMGFERPAFHTAMAVAWERHLVNDTQKPCRVAN